MKAEGLRNARLLDCSSVSKELLSLLKDVVAGRAAWFI